MNDQLLQKITTWIKEQAKIRGLSELVINIANEDSATSLISFLCKRTLLKINNANDDDIKHFKESLVVSSRCKNNNLFIRDYNKFEPVDIMPLADFKLSEVEQLYKIISDNVFKPYNHNGISQQELEWLEELDKKCQIVTSKQDPTKNSSWFKFTIRQKEIIAKVHQVEKITRHKHNPNIPYFKNE